MKLHGVRPALAVAVFAAAVLAACGGGGGGGGATSGPPPVTVTPTPPPPSGYTAPTGPITILSATSSGVFGSAITAGTADGLETAEVPTTPTTPPNAGTLVSYNASVKATAGVGTSSAARASQSARALQALITENRQRSIEDGLRERPSNSNAMRTLLHNVTATRTTSAVRHTHAAPGTVGTQRPFYILTSNIGNSGGCAGGSTSGTYVCNTQITATLKAVSNHANVWVDNNSLNTAGEFSISGEFQTIAQRFDAYYGVETNAFGPAFYPSGQPIDFQYSAAKHQCDASGNAVPAAQEQPVDLTGNSGTSIDIVITDALAGTGEGGYYYAPNEFPQQLWNCFPSPRPISNETSMFVVTGNNYSAVGSSAPTRNESFWLNTDVPRSVSHELQHLLHSHYKYFRPIALGTGQGSFDDAFVEEGCSMLAEDLATDPAPGQHIDTPRYSFTYLAEPSLFSLTSFTGYQPNPSTGTGAYGWYSNTAGSYGQAYLFIRYLYDRFGPSALTTIYNTPGSDGSASAPATVTPVLAAAGGESFAQLYREFATAVSAQNTSAATSPYAFSSAIVLRGNVDVPSVRTGSQSTRHLGFGGPQPPETFSSSNVPNGVLSIGPGTTATTLLVDGGVLYLPSSNGGSGTTITVTAPGAPGLEGSLIQGTLPTPPPSST